MLELACYNTSSLAVRGLGLGFRVSGLGWDRADIKVSSSLLFSVLNFVSDPPTDIRGKDDAVEETQERKGRLAREGGGRGGGAGGGGGAGEREGTAGSKKGGRG